MKARNLSRRLLFFGALSGLLVLVAACGAAVPKSDEQSVVPDGFFRVHADVRVKVTGEIVKIDYVASCGAIVSSWSFTTSSVTYGMAPHVMLVPTESGELIGVRTPDVCDAQMWWPVKIDGETFQNPPADFLPLIMWYPDADNIDFAIGYLSDKAYESPYAKIELMSSGIAKSNLEEWRAWKKAAGDAFKPVGALPGPWGHQQIRRMGISNEEREYLQSLNNGRPVRTEVCFSAGILELPDERKDRILGLLPLNERAWISTQDLDRQQIDALSVALKDVDFNGQSYASHQAKGIELGVRRSTGGGAFFRHKGKTGSAYHDVYPIVPYQRDHSIQSERYDSAWRFELLSDPRWNGFGICGSHSPTPQALTEYSAADAERLNWDVDYFPPISGDPVTAPFLEVVMRDGERVIEMTSYTGYGQIRSGNKSLIIHRSGLIIPDCCFR